MYAELPDGHRLVIAAFTNGWDANEPEPGDVARLGDFTARLLQRLGLDDAAGRAPLHVAGKTAADGSAHWRWRTPLAGRYEIALWYDAAAQATHNAHASLIDATATTRTLGVIDQTTWGHRWIHLGDVELARGKTVLTLAPTAPGDAVAGRLRVTRWPDSTAATR